MQPTLQEAVINQFSPQALGKRGLKVLMQYVELLTDLPKEIRCGIQSVKSGNLQVRIDLNRLEDLQKSLARASNRLAVAAITSALIIGTAIVMSFAKGPVVAGINIFEVFGIGATVGGALLLYHILREKT